MKYKEILFEISPRSTEKCDVLSAWIADLGFETFVESEEGLTAYIQDAVFNEDELRERLLSYPIPETSITWKACDAPDEDWNQAWEEEGFQPIIIGSDITVHDIRHSLPKSVRYDIVINPKLAFGTGNHETTRMILRQLSEMNLKGSIVVDAGTGTGILAIMAVKRGATHVLAYDIDEWSVRNTQENLQANNVAESVAVKLGDASTLRGVSGVNLLIANINRNILLNDMSQYRSVLDEGGRMLLSGFLTEDIPILTDAAQKLGMKCVSMNEENGWAMLLFEADATCRMDV